MTREEAIKIIKECKEKGFKYTFYTIEEYHTALDMAIKALEQEPCPDAISRQAVVDFLENHAETYEDVRVKMGFKASASLINNRNNLPPVNPQPKTGHWGDIMVGDMPAQACDQCNTFYPLAYTGGGHKYCPNCGARMLEIPTGLESRE